MTTEHQTVTDGNSTSPPPPPEPPHSEIITIPASSPLKQHPVDLSRVKLRVRDKMGLSDKRWKREKIEALEKYGHLLGVKISARICLTEGFTTLEQVNKVSAWAADLVSKTDNDVPVGQKLQAAQMVTMCAKAFGELSEKLVGFAEKSEEKNGAKKPKNLPPTLAVQVNVAGASSPSAPATAAISGTPESSQADSA